MTEPSLTTCRKCPHSVFWVRTRNGRNMLLDAEPDPAGDFYLVTAEDGKLEGHHVKGYPGKLPDDVDRYTSHFATCPHADSFRKR